jgi:hypothetical protein
MKYAIGDRADLVVVAQSFGGFTAPLVCHRLPVDLLVLVAGMVPRPGEPPDDWWADTATFGAPHMLDLVARVANHAMKAAWYHKWLVHRRFRPEEAAGRITTT